MLLTTTKILVWPNRIGEIEGARSKVEEEEHLCIHAEQEGRQLSAEECKTEWGN